MFACIIYHLYLSYIIDRLSSILYHMSSIISHLSFIVQNGPETPGTMVEEVLGPASLQGPSPIYIYIIYVRVRNYIRYIVYIIICDDMSSINASINECSSFPEACSRFSGTITNTNHCMNSYFCVSHFIYILIRFIYNYITILIHSNTLNKLSLTI